MKPVGAPSGREIRGRNAAAATDILHVETEKAAL